MNKKNGIKVALMIFVLPLVFTSCKKDFTCTCKSTDFLGNTSTQTYPLDNQTRVDANDACENFEEDNAFQTRNCNL